MDLALLVYGISLLDKIHAFFIGVIIVAVVAAWGMILLPDEKTAYTMVAAYAAQKVTENGTVQQLSGKVLTIIEQKMDGFIEEGTKEVGKKVDKAVSDAKDKVVEEVKK